MNVASLANEKGTAEARDWFLRLLAEDASQEDFLAWNSWMEAAPGHRLAYEAVATAWELAGSAQPHRPSPAELSTDSYTPTLSVAQWRRRRERRGLLWSASAAAACAALVVVAVGVAASLRDEPVQRLETLRAQHLQTNLPDGSTVRLGAMTVAAVSFDSKMRRVELDRGEVLVQVAHEPRRPFVVQTPLGAVTAVGTGFNLDAGPASVALYVTEGAVTVDVSRRTGRARVATDGQSIFRVAAGQRLKISRETSGRLQIVHELDAPQPTWAQGWLQYRDEPLSGVLADVNRYHGSRIVLQDASLGALRYSGSVGLTRIPEWLAGLEAAFQLTAVERNGDVLLTRKSPVSVRPGRI